MFTINSGKFLLLALIAGFFLLSGSLTADPEREFVVTLVSTSRQSTEANDILLRMADFSAYDVTFQHLILTEDNRHYLARLGLSERELPVLGVAEWNVPSDLGPRQFVGDVFARHAVPGDVPRVFQSYARLTDGKERVVPSFESGDALPIVLQAALELQSVRFEASGRPLNVTNFGVRVYNNSLTTVKDLEVTFSFRLDENASWTLLEKRTVDKLPSHQVRSVDYIANSSEIGLLDAEGNVFNCQYRVEVEGGGLQVESIGYFVPSELPVSR